MSNISSTDAIYKLFKAYDVRGTVPTLTAQIYYLTAKGLIETILKPQGLPLTVNLCCDCRYSSPDFYKAFYNGIIDSGGQVEAVGIGASEILYAACQINNFAGAMITASHNPKDDNGIKMVKQIPQMLGLNGGLDKIRDYVITELQNGFDFSKAILKEVQENQELAQECQVYLMQIYDKIGTSEAVDNILESNNKKLKVVVDCGNGMGGFLMPLIQKQYKNIDFIPLYWELDGNFPNHPADPLQEANLIDLQNKVIAEKADLGIAFDGDADRAFFVDEKGERVNNENLVALFAQEMLKLAQNETEQLNLHPAVVYVMSYSRALANTVLENGGACIVAKQGHTFVKEEMKKYRAIYGGEASGHNYFGQFGFMDSGSLTVALMIKLLVTSKQVTSSLLDRWSKIYFTSGEKNFVIPSHLNMNKVKQLLKEKYFDANFNELDGISIFYPNYKITVRGSNTEPLIRVNIETQLTDNTQAILQEIKDVLGL
jgi:phosphomannomutase